MENQSILNNCSIASGFYGLIQDEKNFGIKPLIGYAIVVEDKKFNYFFWRSIFISTFRY